MEKGSIFDIQHFCTGDGPGIRTTVFLKGCTLRCAWCHNPESQAFVPEILLSPSSCIGCGNCDNACPHSDAKGILASRDSKLSLCPPGCTACAEACPSSCLEIAGRTVDVEQVIDEVMQDEAYYRHSGGGITLSGGEPMAQPAFSAALLEAAASRGIHTAVETSGNGRKEDFLAVSPLVDLWIWDIKLMDPALYREHTGGELEAMQHNLRAVAGNGARILFRILFIPDIHNRPAIISSTARLLSEYTQAQTEIVPYHILGNAKREKLGLPERIFREPRPEETEAFRNELSLLCNFEVGVDREMV